LKHYRGKQLIEEVDAYDLLLHGVRGDMARLENGDTLMVQPIGAQVTIEGMYGDRPLRTARETSLEDALELAGAFCRQLLATCGSSATRSPPKTHHVDSRSFVEWQCGQPAKQLSAFKIQDGDQIHIFPIAPYNESAIYLQGHVLRPGRYSYREG